MEQSLVLADDLQKRSKSALTLGILSAAIPGAAVVTAYFGMLLGMIGSIPQMESNGMPWPLLWGLGGMALALLAAGIVMIVLGRKAWHRARRVGLDARAYGVRRPPMSVVAHVLGIGGFASGIYLTVYAAGMFSFLFLAQGVATLARITGA